MKKIKNKAINSEEAQKVLLGCGIYPDKKGYLYLLCAVELFRNTDQSICELYKSVAEIFETSASCVERCIRFCITEAFYANSFTSLNTYFKNDIFKKDTFLTNGDFIAILATYLDMINASPIEIIPSDC